MSMEEFDNKPFELDNLDDMKDDILFDNDAQDSDTEHVQDGPRTTILCEAKNSTLIAIDCENTSNNVVEAISNLPKVDVLIVLGSNRTLEHYIGIGAIKEDTALQRNVYTAIASKPIKNAADVLLGFELGRMVASGRYRTVMILSSDKIFDVIRDRMIDDKINMTILKWNQAGGQADLLTLLHKLNNIKDSGVSLQYFAMNSQNVFQDYFYMNSLVKLGVIEIVMLHGEIGFKVNKGLVKAMLGALSP